MKNESASQESAPIDSRSCEANPFFRERFQGVHNLFSSLRRILFDLFDRERRELRAENETLHKKIDELETVLGLDIMTGLPNYDTFWKQLIEYFMYSQEKPGSYAALMFLDINKFKEINDQRGHDVGDRAIKWFGFLIKKHFRSGRGDLVARRSGDEFLGLVKGITGDLRGIPTVPMVVSPSHIAFLKVATIAERLSQAVSREGEEEVPEGYRLVPDLEMSGAMGISILESPGQNFSFPEAELFANAWCKSAEKAMYRAKGMKTVRCIKYVSARIEKGEFRESACTPESKQSKQNPEEA